MAAGASCAPLQPVAALDVRPARSGADASTTVRRRVELGGRRRNVRAEAGDAGLAPHADDVRRRSPLRTARGSALNADGVHPTTRRNTAVKWL